MIVIIAADMIASSAVIFPIIAYLTARQRAEALFEAWKSWRTQNNQTVAALTLLVMGGLLIIRGLVIVGTI